MEFCPLTSHGRLARRTIATATGFPRRFAERRRRRRPSLGGAVTQHELGAAAMEITTVGLDLAKDVF